jgi:O-antigen/teichoic acid export membrane protein
VTRAGQRKAGTAFVSTDRQPVSTGSTKRAVAVNFMGNLAAPLVGFISAPIMAHGLGVDARGTVSAAVAPLTLAASMFTLGLPDALTFFLARYPHLKRKALGQASWISIAAGAIAMVLIALLASTLSGGRPELSRLIVVATIALIPTLILQSIRGAAAAQLKWRAIAVDSFIGALSRLLALILLLATGHLDVFTTMVTLAASPLLGLLVYIPWRPAPLQTTLPVTPSNGAEEVGARKLLGFAMQVWLGSVMGVLLSSLDQTLMTPLSSTAELGIYAVAVTVSQTSTVFNQAVARVIMASESSEPNAQRIAFAARVTALITLLISGVTAVGSIPLLPILFGREFAPAVPVLAVLLLALLAGSPGSVAGSGLGAFGRPILRSVSIGIGFVANVVAIFAFVPQHGAMGAAAATVVGSVVAGGFNIVWLSRMTDVPMTHFFAVKRSDVGYLIRAASSVTSRLSGVRK